MAVDLIPERVREFIATNIESIAELEALLLLRSDPACDWTVDALTRRLYTNHEQTVEVMEKLTTNGLSAVKHGEPVTFHYQPSPKELKQPWQPLPRPIRNISYR